ncbi:hypothetical protein [Streptomyces cyaneochromogenes]|nr:hypothetical protein [Streptomyces cyaneochromogenes]
MNTQILLLLAVIAVIVGCAVFATPAYTMPTTAVASGTAPDSRRTP